MGHISFGGKTATAETETVDCEGADSIRYGGAMGAAADSFISTKSLMDIRFLESFNRTQRLSQVRVVHVGGRAASRALSKPRV